MPTTNGRNVLLEVLRSEGVVHCFGNPGTTELPFVDALAEHPEVHYVLGLQENVAVAMADGYAQASGRPSFVNLHTVAGLGGGLGNLTNALANRTPMVVTAGQQDRRHLLAEPILSGDLVGLARAATKWQHEVRHLGELGPVLRRAFLDAAHPPAGPVFVSIPMDVLDETGDVEVPARPPILSAPVAGGLAALVPLVAGKVDAGRVEGALSRARQQCEGTPARFDAMAVDRAGELPMHPMAATHALLAALPPGGALVDEAITTGFHVRMLFRSQTPGSYYFCRGGGLGWGVPAALGVKLARPDQPVLCIVGDGSIMYSVQALWTAAHESLPVVIAVVNNRQYAILKTNLAGSRGRSAETGRFVAMDLDEPPIDYVGLARAMGVDAAVVEKAADVTEATRSALESGRPTLLELPISPP